MAFNNPLACVHIRAKGAWNEGGLTAPPTKITSPVSPSFPNFCRNVPPNARRGQAPRPVPQQGGGGVASAAGGREGWKWRQQMVRMYEPPFRTAEGEKSSLWG